MPAFFSDNEQLMLPAKPHSDDNRYLPVEIGKPLCIELLEVGYGDIDDGKGLAEVMISTFVKTGARFRPGPRVINGMKEKIDRFSHLEGFGGQEYGNPLVYYTPAYSGEEIRTTVDLLEIDKKRRGSITEIANGISSLGKLAALFVPQLAFLSLAGKASKVLSGIINLFKKNDFVLNESLDLAFKAADKNVLTAGRFVLVEGAHDQVAFAENFKLLRGSNRLVTTAENRPAHDVGMVDPYVVLRIEGIEKKDYEKFEVESEQQQLIEDFLDEGIAKELSDVLSDTVTAAVAFKSVGNVLKITSELKALEEGSPEHAAAKAKIESELAKLPDQEKSAIKSALGI